MEIYPNINHCTALYRAVQKKYKKKVAETQNNIAFRLTKKLGFDIIIPFQRQQVTKVVSVALAED